MSDTPKFEVIDRRKMKAEEEKVSGTAPAQTTPPEKPAAPAPSEPAPGPRLVVNEAKQEAKAQEPAPAADDQQMAEELPPAPTAEESSQQKAAYDASAQRLEDLIRAQNPAVGAQPPVGFEHLVQQFYLSAMLQMGAGTQEGQRPRVDIMGARATIDLLGVLAAKTKGNLSEAEDRMLQSVLFELRMAFLELTSMVGAPSVPPVKS
ncbi:MAG: DUF1844 domain-containing protein [Terracidiphilus sp.]|nr:DUF1844 domain-containing protein [Terracidiphilus sp.]MDR3797738.1 DUF1844 domain-containing protein [Terracidiphilus sp.]